MKIMKKTGIRLPTVLADHSASGANVSVDRNGLIQISLPGRKVRDDFIMEFRRDELANLVDRSNKIWDGVSRTSLLRQPRKPW